MSENDGYKNYVNTGESVNPVNEIGDDSNRLLDEPVIIPVDPTNYIFALMVQMNRIYDLLMLIARSQNLVEAKGIEQLHDEGHWLAPPVIYVPEEYDEDE